MNARLGLTVIFPFLVAVAALGQIEPTVPGGRAGSAKDSSVLLVTTDLDCDWTVDGESQGRLKADEIRKVRVRRGEHLVRAVAANGRDMWKGTVIVAQWQTTLQIPLSGIRQMREEKEQREVGERKIDEALKLEATQKQKRFEKVVWSDPDTGLMWTRQDNGYDLNWQQAESYCAHLDLAGYRDWRLPAITELVSIYDPKRGDHVKGGIQITESWIWSSAIGSSSLIGSSAYFTDPFHMGMSDKKALSFGFVTGARYASWIDDTYMQRTLCVRVVN